MGPFRVAVACLVVGLAAATACGGEDHRASDWKVSTYEDDVMAEIEAAAAGQLEARGGQDPVTVAVFDDGHGEAVAVVKITRRGEPACFAVQVWPYRDAVTGEAKVEMLPGLESEVGCSPEWAAARPDDGLVELGQ